MVREGGENVLSLEGLEGNFDELADILRVVNHVRYWDSVGNLYSHTSGE